MFVGIGREMCYDGDAGVATACWDRQDEKLQPTMIFAGTIGMFCCDRRSDVLASVTACWDWQDEKLQPAMIFLEPFMMTPRHVTAVTAFLLHPSSFFGTPGVEDCYGDGARHL